MLCRVLVLLAVLAVLAALGLVWWLG